jgi:NADH dehydrogenase
MALGRTPVEVVLVDRTNHHLFQPLLYQVATATLSPNQIAVPIRQILSRQRNATVLMEQVEGIDLAARQVVTSDRRISFNYLVVATGARHAYFGHDDWEAVAPGLKRIDEATAIRRRLLMAFERAEVLADRDMRRAALTFAVVGGGPTGVEMAGAIAELARNTLARDYRNICTADTRVVLIEAGARLLPAFPDRLSASAEAQLARLDVEVLKGEAVVACTADGVQLTSGRRIGTALTVWAAGVMASPAARWLGAAADRAGRVQVGPDLRLPGQREVFVIGDTAAVTDARGTMVPGIAPAAKQMGRYAACAIGAEIAGRASPAFVYRDWGNLATIGRGSAVADVGRLRLTGGIAWLLWGLVHVGFLIGFRNRLTVMVDWAWSYLFHARGARLITGGPDAGLAVVEPAEMHRQSQVPTLPATNPPSSGSETDLSSRDEPSEPEPYPFPLGYRR